MPSVQDIIGAKGSDVSAVGEEEADDQAHIIEYLHEYLHGRVQAKFGIANYELRTANSDAFFFRNS